MFLLLVCFTLICGYLYFTRTFNYWKGKGVVGPKPIVLFGNLKDVLLRRKNIPTFYKEIYDSYPNEKVVGIYRMTKPCLLIRDLDILKHILIKDFNIFSDRGIRLSARAFGHSLFHADGETWQVLRHYFSPIFSSGKLKNMIYLLDEIGDRFMEHVEQICKQQAEHDVQKLVQKFTVDSIYACVFGLDVNKMDKKMDSIFQKIDEVALHTHIGHEINMMYPNLLKSLDISILPSYIHDAFQDIVQSVIRQRNGIPTNRKDFMDCILELRQQKTLSFIKKGDDKKTLTLELTDYMILSQALVFYVGGYETSASTMSFMLYELARNPDVQNKLLAEIDEALEKLNGPITYESLFEMSYLQNTIKETMRMYAIAEIVRVAEKDYKIPGTNITIEKGVSVVISNFGIQNDEKHFPNAHKFDPDRFKYENSKERHPCAYIPAGIGPRSCVGIRFGTTQTSVCIVKLLSKFRVEVSSKTPDRMKFEPKKLVLNSLGGVHLNLIQRKY